MLADIVTDMRPFALHAGAIAAAAVGLYFFWKLCRAVVKWGFFLAYFVLGSLIAYALQPGLSIGVTLAGGLAFAWTVMAIKRKLFKAIGAIAVIAAMPFMGPISKKIGGWAFGPTPQAAPRTAPKHPPRERGIPQSRPKS